VALTLSHGDVASGNPFKQYTVSGGGSLSEQSETSEAAAALSEAVNTAKTTKSNPDATQADVINVVRTLDGAKATVLSIAGYVVPLADGIEDAENWTIEPSTAKEGETVTVNYRGNRRVKDVKAVKK